MTAETAVAGRRPSAPARGLSDGVRLVLLAGGALLAVVAFLTIGADGHWDFVLAFRGRRLLALVGVGVAIAVSTVLFQTVTENRILTPSIMGFDALYGLIQTTLVFALGSTAVNTLAGPRLFTVEVALMLVFSLLLFSWLFGGARRSLHLLVLVGIVFGVFFRSLATFMQRIIDPNEYLILADRLFASFNAVDTRLLPMALALIAGVCAVVWALRRQLDVLALGQPVATALGVDHRRLVLVLLGLSSVLVAVSTALVGPVTFFGLLVANLAYQVMRTERHAVVLPAACLLAVLTLVGGQAVLEHVLGLDTVLSVIIEFVGGLVFISLLVRRSRR